jgi:hypothetical protein
LDFDPAVLHAQSVRVGTLTAGWSMSANLNVPGRLVIVLASPTALSGSGTLASLTFIVVGAPGSTTSLTLSHVLLNDGSITVQTNHGSFTVNGYWSIQGFVRYFQSGTPVQRTGLTALGTRMADALTASDGAYLLTNLPTGSYQVLATKVDDVRGITAYDASLVLQAAVGLISLDPTQLLAADVNRNGRVSSLDASYILEKAAQLIDVPFPGAGEVWDFLPTQHSYALVNGDLTHQDFTAVLIGDVSGNWTPIEGSGPSPLRIAGNAFPVGNSLAILALEDEHCVVSNPHCRRLLLKSPVPVYSLDLELAYDPWITSLQDVQTTLLTEQFALVSNQNAPGLLLVAMAGAHPTTEEGAIVCLCMTNAEAANLRILRACLNEGAVPVAIETSAAIFDDDGDGLINADELSLYGTNPRLSDSDGDRLDDGMEVRAGTNPNDHTSVLTMTGIEQAPDGTRTLHWASIAGKRYQIKCADSLTSGAWQTLISPITATHSVSAASLPASSNATLFYRIQLLE